MNLQSSCSFVHLFKYPVAEVCSDIMDHMSHGSFIWPGRMGFDFEVEMTGFSIVCVSAVKYDRLLASAAIWRWDGNDSQRGNSFGWRAGVTYIRTSRRPNDGKGLHYCLKWELTQRKKKEKDLKERKKKILLGCTHILIIKSNLQSH